MLRDDVTVEQVGDVLWVLCSFERLDALYTSRGNSIDEAIEVTAWTAEQALCRPPDQHDDGEHSRIERSYGHC